MKTSALNKVLYGVKFTRNGYVSKIILSSLENGFWNEEANSIFCCCTVYGKEITFYFFFMLDEYDYLNVVAKIMYINDISDISLVF